MKLLWCAALAAASLSAQTFAAAPALDEVIGQAIAQDRLPGAVLLVGHNGQVVYRKAYGKRALVPQPEAMTLDTIFDCASLTKVVATTTSRMQIFSEEVVPTTTTGSPTTSPSFRAARATSPCASCSPTSPACNPTCHSLPRGPVTTPASSWPAPSRWADLRPPATCIATSISSCSANWCTASAARCSTNTRGRIFSCPSA